MHSQLYELSEADKREAHTIANEVKNGINWGLKVAYGEMPRPQKSLRESMLELQKEIDEENAAHG